MKHSTKMVLIPESEYRRLRPEEGIKDKTNKILRGKRDRKTATELSQIFGRYLRTTKPEKEIQPLTKEEIVTNLPAMYRDKVSNFLSQLQKHGSSWSDNFDFVTKSGQVIGNIVDLLKEAFVSSRGIRGDVPKGWDQFIKEIVAADIARGMITKKSTKDYIAQEKGRRKRVPIEWENF